jgi:vancomycin aglycone glucosyltransferase
LRFLLATYGSRGDVHPMLALALALGRRGHQVVLAGPPDFADDARRAEVDFRPMGRSMTQYLADNSRDIGVNMVRFALRIKPILASEVAAQFAVLTELAAESDVVVGASLAFAARSCAEASGKPYTFIAFAPETFPSRHHPSPGVRWQGQPRLLNRLGWWLARRLDNWMLREALDGGRAQLGLPPLEDVLDHVVPARLSLLATDEELAPSPSDVPLAAPPTGAWLLPDQLELSDEVERFLSAGPPPVYFGFGSMPDARSERTRGVLVKTVRALGCRAIVFSGAAGIGGVDLGPSILSVGPLPHDRLFPRVALAVHHGGSGTCARVARAGIPQVIVPHVLDQFPFAHRLYRRGLAAKPLWKARIGSRALIARIGAALDDTGMRERAAAVGRALRGRDGVEQAVEILTGRERVAGSSA